MTKTVLLHGWGMNQGVWQLVRAPLQNALDEEVITLDLPGFGDEKRVPKPYSLEAGCDILASQIPDQSRIIAWSLGGLFALTLAQKYPQKVREIVLVASTPYFQQVPQWPGIKPDVLSLFMEQLSTAHDKTVDRFLAIQTMGSETAKADIKQLKAMLNEYPKASSEALSGGLEMLQQDDLRALFTSLKVPINGVFGRLDSLVPKRVIKPLTALRPDFEYYMLDKASHAPFISHPTEFISAIQSIIRT